MKYNITYVLMHFLYTQKDIVTGVISIGNIPSYSSFINLIKFYTITSHAGTFLIIYLSSNNLTANSLRQDLHLNSDI